MAEGELPGTLCVVGFLLLSSKIFAYDIIRDRAVQQAVTYILEPQPTNAFNTSFQTPCKCSFCRCVSLCHLREFIFPNRWFQFFTFSFQPPESRRSCTPSPRREWRSPSLVPARRGPPPFVDATTATRVHQARGGSGAAAARTWSSEPWSPGSSPMRGRTDPTRARLWTGTTTRQEEWWVSTDCFSVWKDLAINSFDVFFNISTVS